MIGYRFILSNIIIIILIFLKININAQSSDIQWVDEIFERIINTIGDNSLDEPTLNINKYGNGLAHYSPNDNIIHIDQKVIDICKEFKSDSANCIAFILGHELCHRYSNHGWVDRSLRKEYKEFSFMENLKTLSRDSLKRLEMESQADLKGGFYTFLAGYNSLEIASELLDTLYKRYNLPKQSKNYPSLSERKKIVSKQLEKLNRLKNIFSFSTYCFVIGEYDFAIDGFKKIIKEGFVSKEIYNNLGILYFKSAIKLMRSDDIFAYPFEFDAESRLNENSTRAISNFTNHLEIKKLIDFGIKYLNQAIKRDPYYNSAYLNLSCGNSILAELYSSDGNLKKDYIKKSKNNLSRCTSGSDDRTIVEAILLYQEGETTSSVKLFKKLSKSGNNLAAINLFKIKVEEFDSSFDECLNVQKNMDSFNPNNILFGFEDFNEPFNSYRLTNYKLLCKEMPSSKVFLYEGSGSERFLLQSTNLLSTTSGIKIGDDIRVFKNKFSEKPDIFKTNIETYYCFPTCNLFFVVINEKIKSWLIYQSSI